MQNIPLLVISNNIFFVISTEVLEYLQGSKGAAANAPRRSGEIWRAEKQFMLSGFADSALLNCAE